MLVFALGIKAVGKSRVIAEMNKLGAGIKEVSYGDAMLDIAREKEGIKDREEIAKLPASRQNAIRDAAAKRIRAMADKEKLVFLNTHGFIYTIPGHTYLPGSPDSVSDVLKPEFILLVEATPEAIIERRARDLKAGRKREVGSAGEVATALTCERVAALHLSARFGAQLKFFDNTQTVQENSEAIGSLVKLFKTLEANDYMQKRLEAKSYPSRAQTSVEYLVMLGGVVFFGVFLFLVLKGELLPNLTGSTNSQTGGLLDEYGHAYKFYDQFSTDSLHRYKNVDPSWTIQNGVLVQAYNGGFLPLTVGDTTWQNYAISADVHVENGFPTGVVARYSSGFYYFCGISNFQDAVLYLGNSENFNFNSFVPLGRYHFSNSYSPAWHKTYFKVDGNKLTCRVDNFPDLTAVNYNAQYGAPGIFGYSISAKFDNFKVSYLPDSVEQTPAQLVIQNPQCNFLPGNPLAPMHITWQTNIPSDAYVVISNNTFQRPFPNSTLATDHLFDYTFSDWLPGDTYFYTLWDSYDNLYARSTTTACATPPPVPPVISNVQSLPSPYFVWIRWVTNPAADGQVEYGLTTSYGSWTTLNTQILIGHNDYIYGLSPSTLYHFAVKSCTAPGVCSVSSDYTFTTP